MFVKAHKTGSLIKADNKGSCKALAEYLDKEKDEAGESSFFFNPERHDLDKKDVINSIDNNVKGLKNKDDKFYMLSINPSEKELKYIVGRDVDNPKLLTSEEKEKLNIYLAQYTKEVMNKYAENFGREHIRTGDDLVYFAKIETQREWRYTDKEVIEGREVAGRVKPGLNYHVHVIVSRNAKDGKTKLSPHAKSRGNTWEKDGRTMKRGFDHEVWKVKSQESFNSMFNYKSEDAYKHISKLNKSEIFSEIKNEDLKIILSKSNDQVKDIIKQMEDKGYSCNYEYGKINFKNGYKKFSVSYKKLYAFTNECEKRQQKFNNTNRKQIYQSKNNFEKFAGRTSATGVHRMINKAKTQMLQGNLNNERNFMKNSFLIYRAVKSPPAAIKTMLRRQIRAFLSGSGNYMGM